VRLIAKIAGLTEIVYSSGVFLTPKAFANFSPGQRPGTEVDEKRRTLKELANAIGNPFRVAKPFPPDTQGSALTRATLGWRLSTLRCESLYMVNDEPPERDPFKG